MDELDLKKAMQFLISPKNSVQEVSSFYESCAGIYENLTETLFFPVEVCVQTAIKYNSDRNCVIVDACSGTGRVGRELLNQNYKNVDAIEPSKSMIENGFKGYRNIFQKFITEEPINEIKANTYDLCTMLGGLAYGHFPPNGFDEIVRIVKKGGFAVIANTYFYLENSPEYWDGIQEKLKQLAKDGFIEEKERQIIDYLDDDKQVLLLVFKVI
ncbi:DgyrCDS14958 [Dimorphilus gyrociliatus]|uniref:DgyrCDS14958 n=1 Tax=Dimorphilus gyrociliatus TaxID=2664684 RepID=A0A7I8WFM7_9ANNE|nr:DgyrCDS14958 [Dimorphilus gyrociliatus]